MYSALINPEDWILRYIRTYLLILLNDIYSHIFFVALMRNDRNVPKAQRVATKPFINIYTSAGRDIAHFKVRNHI